jgi:hypothetical protein
MSKDPEGFVLDGLGVEVLLVSWISNVSIYSSSHLMW